MKLAITSTGTTIDSQVDPAFGRCQRFIIVDLETDETEIVDNAQNLELSQGAGLQAAGTVADRGTNCVLTGHCGPKAFRALTAAGILVIVGVEGTVKTAIEEYRAGHLKPAKKADVEGHWI